MSKRTTKSLMGLVLLLAALVTLTGCRREPATPAPRDGKLKVVTTFFPVYCFTANVAGDLAEVDNLLPPGSGPHGYSFTARDGQRLSAAQLVIMNGLGLDDWLSRSIRNLSSKHRPDIVVMSSGMSDQLIECVHDTHNHDHGHDHSHHHDHGTHDPHVWLDPILAIEAVNAIREALQQADPGNADGYAANAEAYIARLKALDSEIAEDLKNAGEAPFVTFHNAFPYFIRRYGLTLAAVVEQTPDVSPSPKQQKQLYETIRETKARVLFTEPQFSARLARRISEDLGIPIAELDPLETGPFERSAYETAMRNNVAVLKERLK